MSDQRLFQAMSLIVVLVLCATPANAETTAIIGGTILDGNGGAPLRNGVIIIEGERIVSVGSHDEVIPSHARRIHAEGKYVIPGLMDANVHLVYGFSTEYLLRFENHFEDIIREAAQIALKSGVTTVFDTWGPLDSLMTVRDEIHRGELEASRIFLGGNIVGLSGPLSPDFYASTEGVGKETIQRINEMYERGTGHELVYMAQEQVRAAIRRYLTHDIDFLKYAVSGHGTRLNGFIVFSPGVQGVIMEEARQRGLIVQTHTTSVESLRIAVDAGVDLMQHCNLTTREVIPDELVRKIANRKVPCAMQIFPQRYLRHALGANFGAEGASMEDDAQRLLAVMALNGRKLIDANATILMATDGGVEYRDDPLLQQVFFRRPYPEIRQDIVGFFGHGHSAWFRGAYEAGLPPMRILQAATRNIAAAYKKLNDLGTLEPGKIADLVILNADPLLNPANYTAINVVMKAGRIVNRDALPTVRVLTAQRCAEMNAGARSGSSQLREGKIAHTRAGVPYQCFEKSN